MKTYKVTYVAKFETLIHVDDNETPEDVANDLEPGVGTYVTDSFEVDAIEPE